MLLGTTCPWGLSDPNPKAEGSVRLAAAPFPTEATCGGPSASPAKCRVGSLSRSHLQEMDGLPFLPRSLIVTAGYKIFLFS